MCWAKVEYKAKNVPMDGLGMTSKLKSGKQQAIRMGRVQHSGRMPIIRLLVPEGQNWLRLNYDSGAAVTALPIVIAGDLPLKKCGEFRVWPSGAVIPNLGKIKMKLMDESGTKRTVRGNITEVSKQLLSAAEASKRWDSILFRSLVVLEVRAILRSMRFGIVMARTCKGIQYMCELAIV